MPVTRSQSVTASERAESPHPETTPIKWSKHHQSPKAEVILVSSDNVSFKVDVWYLRQKSTFISDLLDLPSSQSIESAPIHFDQNVRHVRLFVDLVLSSGTALMYFELDDCKPLLDICDRLQAPDLDKLVWKALTRRLQSTTLFKNLSPWDIFRLAANRGDNHVCGLAITAFQIHGYQFDDICSQPASFYDGISSRYLATLLTGNYRWKIKHGGESTYTQLGWREIADRFNKLDKGGSNLHAGIAG